MAVRIKVVMFKDIDWSIAWLKIFNYYFPANFPEGEYFSCNEFRSYFHHGKLPFKLNNITIG